jgi:hypothetical protein
MSVLGLGLCGSLERSACRAAIIAAPVACAGCNAAFWGNLGVLCVTVAIFLGTVFLSRSSEANRSATRSSPSTTTQSS